MLSMIIIKIILSLQLYKKFWESGARQETHIGFYKTFCK